MIRWVLGSLFLALPSIAIAGTSPGQTLSLRQAVQQALQDNRLLLSESALLDEATARVKQADGNLLPRLTASSSVSRSNSPMNTFAAKLLQERVTATDFAPANLNNPSYVTNYQDKLTLEVPVYQGGRLWASKDRAEQAEQATRYQVSLARQQVIFAVIQAYSNVFRLQSREKAAKSAYEAATDHLKQATALVDRGIGIQSDILDAQAHVSDTQLALTRTHNARLSATENLLRLLGLPSTATSVKLRGAPELQLHGISKSTSPDMLVARHPKLVALEHQLAAARAGISEASAGLRPKIGLVATEEWNNSSFAPRHPNTTLGAELSINLFAGGSDIAARHAAEASYAHLQYQVQDERQVLRNALADAWRQLHEAQAAVKARNDALRQTTESLRIQDLRFKQGLEKSSDVLDAQTRNDRAVANDIDARFNLIISRASLLLAAGRLTPEVLDAAH